jgi:hypothetical protein
MSSDAAYESSPVYEQNRDAVTTSDAARHQAARGELATGVNARLCFSGKGNERPGVKVAVLGDCVAEIECGRPHDKTNSTVTFIVSLAGTTTRPSAKRVCLMPPALNAASALSRDWVRTDIAAI